MAMIDVLRADEMSRLGVCADDDCHGCRRELQALLRERFGIRHTTLQVDHESWHPQGSGTATSGRPMCSANDGSTPRGTLRKRS